MSLSDVVMITMLHYVADFFLQSNWMAINKPKDIRALPAHVLVYSTVMVLVSPLFALVNGVLHAIVDKLSSTLLSIPSVQKDRRIFFNIIGLDQTTHYVILFSTYYYMQQFGVL